MGTKTIIYIDMDDVMCDFSNAYKENVTPTMKYPQSQMDFFRKLKPIDLAVDAFELLSNQKDVEVYILTAPSEKNPLSYTEKRLWVEDHLGLGAVNRLIISPHKELLKGDYLIDDNVKGKGQDTFEGTLINFGSVKYPSWEYIIDFLYEELELERDYLF